MAIKTALDSDNSNTIVLCTSSTKRTHQSDEASLFPSPPDNEASFFPNSPDSEAEELELSEYMSEAQIDPKVYEKWQEDFTMVESDFVQQVDGWLRAHISRFEKEEQGDFVHALDSLSMNTKENWLGSVKDSRKEALPFLELIIEDVLRKVTAIEERKIRDQETQVSERPRKRRRTSMTVTNRFSLHDYHMDQRQDLIEEEPLAQFDPQILRAAFEGSACSQTFWKLLAQPCAKTEASSWLPVLRQYWKTQPRVWERAPGYMSQAEVDAPHVYSKNINLPTSDAHEEKVKKTVVDIAKKHMKKKGMKMYKEVHAERLEMQSQMTSYSTWMG